MSRRYHHHGHTNSSGYRSPTYRSWQTMIERCTNANHIGWERYGGRGITVCPAWRDFPQFLADMGERPAGHTLDRIDNDGPYEPGNARWATPQAQNQNRRRGNKLTVENVRAIKRQIDSGDSPKEIASRFDISAEMVRGIASRKFWAHI